MQNKCILVTGGAGFIGSHLCEGLSKNNEVTAFDNLSVGSGNLNLLEENGVSFVKGDIRNLETLVDVSKSMDIVFHLAAMNRAQKSIDDPLEANTINIDGTLNVLEACRQSNVKRFVFASSSSVYGGSYEVNSEELALNPLHPYAVGKVAAEAYTKIYNPIYNLNTIIIRYFSVFGPRQRGDLQYAAVIPKFIESALKNEDITIFGSGEQKRNFTYVKDTMLGTILAADSMKHGVFNIASDSEVSVKYIAEKIIELTGSQSKIVYLPPLKGDPLTNTASTKRAAEELDYKEQFSFDEGLQKTIEFMKKS